MINTQRCIVIGDNHHNTLGVVRSLGEKGIESIVIVLGKSAYLLSSSKYVTNIHLANDGIQLINILNGNYYTNNYKHIIYTCCDKAASIIDSYSNELASGFIFFKGKERNAINYFMDKNNMQEEALKLGILCPKTITFSSESHYDAVPMPCMIKPVSSLDAGKSELKKCSSIDELKMLVTPGLTYQLQEYIEKDYELSIVGCSLDGGKKLIIPGVIRKIREYPYKKGSSSFAILEDLSQYPFINVNKISELISSIGYEGLFSIEFLCKNEKAYFLEINMRNDGNGYVPNAAGINLPYIFFQYMTSGCVQEIYAKLPVYFMNDSTDWIYVLKGKLSLVEWIKSVQKTNVFLLWNSKDMKPFFSNIKVIVKRKISRLFTYE